MRYAGYVRISSDDQVGNFSIDAQKHAIQNWVKAHGGKLVKMYADEAHTGRDENRPAFQEMRRDARKGKFDALIVHKFDRLARNRANALAFKSLLRHDYDIKVLSVTEPSEDSDGPLGALIEGIMEAVAEWYSLNLATEVAKGKLERARTGLQNNGPPFGYDKNEAFVLIINAHEAEGVRLAFGWYRTGKYSDTKIARMLNEHGYGSKTGRPFSKDTVRDLLQNRTYLGFIRYQEYRRNTDGSRSTKTRVQWFKGQHEAILDEEVFEACQHVRARKAPRKGVSVRQRHPYPLSGLIYCGKCNRKLRAQSDRRVRRYRCRARELGSDCEQTSVRADEVEAQVVAALKTLAVPEDWRERMTAAVAEILGDQQLEARLKEIRETIERMDFRWDHGFITDADEYLEKRLALQEELEQVTPIPDEDLAVAEDLIQNFGDYWDAASHNPVEQERLLNLMLVRVWVEDDDVVRLCLRPNLHITAGLDVKRPTEMAVDLDCYQNGSDGHGTLGGYVFFGKNPDQRFLSETIGQAQKAA
jgi:site-specific DNA recombinase